MPQWLKPRGRFLFTSGEHEGTTESEMNGVLFRYISLGSLAYRRIASRAVMRLVDAHADLRENYVYIAEQCRDAAVSSTVGRI